MHKGPKMRKSVQKCLNCPKVSEIQKCAQTQHVLTKKTGTPYSIDQNLYSTPNKTSDGVFQFFGWLIVVVARTSSLITLGTGARKIEYPFPHLACINFS